MTLMYRFLLILALCFTASITSASAQRKELRRFTDEYSDATVAQSFGLNLFPFRFISWFIPAKALDGDAADLKWALKKVRRVKVYAIADADITPESIELLKEDLYKNSKFEPLMEMSRKGSDIQVLSQGKNDDRLDNLVLLIRHEDDMIMMHLRTKITTKDLNRLVNRLHDSI